MSHYRMFRDLIPLLSNHFHLIAPDYPGFGHSAAPSTTDFTYTFDHLTDVIQAFTDRLGLDRYALYMQDFGGPVGFRLASRRPERISFLVIQNANAYTEGLPDSFWAPLREFWHDPSPANRATIAKSGMSDEALEWNYTHGTADPTRINPDSWLLQRALLNRPGNKEAMLGPPRPNLPRIRRPPLQTRPPQRRPQPPRHRPLRPRRPQPRDRRPYHPIRSPKRSVQISTARSRIPEPYGPVVIRDAPIAARMRAIATPMSTTAT